MPEPVRLKERHDSALDQALDEDRARGVRPAAIVATEGTTTTTAFDPIAGVVERARREGAFLHVDAAMAGSAVPGSCDGGGVIYFI